MWIGRDRYLSDLMTDRSELIRATRARQDRLEAELETVKRSLREYEYLEATENLSDGPESRFVGKKAREIIPVLLKEHDQPILQKTMKEMALAGGMDKGSRRKAGVNFDTGFAKLLQNGKITMTKDGMVGFPEWKKK
jgi:hypothetical protein